MAENELPIPSEAAVDWIKTYPSRVAEFDQKFGEGAAAKYAGITALEPEVTPQANTEEEDGDGFLVDMGKGVVEGIVGAAREFGQTIQGMANSGPSTLDPYDPAHYGLDRKLTSNTGRDLTSMEVRDAAKEERRQQVASALESMTVFDKQRDTVAGSITQGMAQFLTGYFTGGGPRTFLGALAKGAIVDAAAFDPYEKNLSATLQDIEWAEPYVLDALATDPNDPEWENRLRNSLEGGVLGIGLEATLRLIKFVAVGRKAKLEITELGEMSQGTASQLDDLAEQIKALEIEAKGPSSKLVAKPDGTFEQPDGTVYRPNGDTLEQIDVKPLDLPEAGPVSRLDNTTDVDAIPARPEASPARPEIQSQAERLADQVEPEVVNVSPKVPVIDKAILRQRLSTLDDISEADVGTGSWFNVTRMTGPVEAQQVIKGFQDVLDDAGVSKKLGIDKPETHDTVTKGAIKYLADVTETDSNQLIRDLNLTETVTRQMTKKLVAGKMALQSTAREINTLSAKVDEAFKQGRADEVMERKLFDLMQLQLEIMANVKGIQTASARATSAGRIFTADILDDGALDAMSAFGGSDKIRALAKKLRSVKDPAGTTKMVKKAMERKWIGVLNEYWINQILSGYKTHALNMSSNAINLFLLPAERAVGGIGQGLRTGDYTQAQQALKQYRYLASSMLEAVQMAGKVAYREETVLDNAFKVDLPSTGMKQISGRNFGLDGTRRGTALDIMGKAVRLPSRMLMAEDEFFKQTAFRARLKAILDVKASKMTPKELKELGYASKSDFMNGEFEKAFNSKISLEEKWQEMTLMGKVEDNAEVKAKFIEDQLGGYNAGNADALNALREARAATFTTPLERGGTSHSIQMLANRHPFLRQILPFIQTPMNVMGAAWDRTPVLNLLHKQYRQALNSSDEAIRAEAIGKMATGTVIVSAVGMLAYEGKITGGGPADRRLATNWKASKDWQPYSVNFGSDEKPNWISIARLDPHGFLFGIIGDLVEIRQMSKNSPEFDTTPLLAATIAAVGNNIISKTYLQGISDVVGLFDSKDQPWRVEQFLNQKIASFVPYSSMQSQLGAAFDENLRDVRGLTDTLRSKWMLSRDKLAVRHDWLTGEAQEGPEHYLGYIQAKRLNDEDTDAARVSAEIRKLGYGFMGPDRRIGSITLTTQQFQDWNREMGSVRIGGKTLVQALNREMDKSRYQNGPDYGVVTPQESHRVAAFSKIIQRYKKKAKRALMQGNPELKEAVRDYDRFKKKSQRGRDAGERPVLDMNLQ